MTADLHTRILAEVERLRTHVVGCASCTTCEATAGYRALADVVELCTTSMAAGVDGTLTDADMLWPSYVLDTIADALGATEGSPS